MKQSLTDPLTIGAIVLALPLAVAYVEAVGSFIPLLMIISGILLFLWLGKLAKD